MNVQTMMASVLPVASAPMQVLARGSMGSKAKKSGKLTQVAEELFRLPPRSSSGQPRVLPIPDGNESVFADAVLPGRAVLAPSERAQLCGLRTLAWVYDLGQRLFGTTLGRISSMVRRGQHGN